jgi:hypothetical protein
MAARSESPESVSSARFGGNDHVSGLGISDSSSGDASVGRNQPQPQPQAEAAAAAACGRPETEMAAAEAACGRVQDRLVWLDPKPSKKMQWRGRKERQQAAAPYRRRDVAPEMDGHCFNCFREGHMKRVCLYDKVCIRCGEEGHEARECAQPRNPAT